MRPKGAVGTSGEMLWSGSNTSNVASRIVAKIIHEKMHPTLFSDIFKQ